MEKDDVELIQNILAGDEAAFSILVKKYQKGVHALVWRKVKDFHIAEEITQDTFLQAHKKLDSLKNPRQFPGWLYVIADRLCRAWFRKKQLKKQLDTQSLEVINEEHLKKLLIQTMSVNSVKMPQLSISVKSCKNSWKNCRKANAQ